MSGCGTGSCGCGSTESSNAAPASTLTPTQAAAYEALSASMADAPMLVPSASVSPAGSFAAAPVARINGVALNSPQELLDEESLRQRACTELLRQAAQQRGTQFEFGTRVARLTSAPAGVQLEGESTPRPFDAVVLCAGAQSAALLQPLGQRLPLVALYGSSVSAPLREELHAPLAAVVDVQTRTTMVRLGQRVRVSGGAELGTSTAQAHPQTLGALYRVLGECFPGGLSHSSGLQVWRGARPMLPDGPPMVGQSAVPGLWLNLGHGASGWALACGSARALADQMAGKTPDIDLEGLGAQRF